ncbi:MAG: hypothetical protein QXX95_01385 [Nitrososphaerales archaeon]
MKVEELYNYFKAEKENPMIQDVPKDLYKRIAQYLSRFENLEESKEIGYLLLIKERNLLIELAERLINLRLEKAKKLEETDEQLLKLTDEEKYILHPFKREVKRKNLVLEALKMGRVKQLEKASRIVSSRTLLVRFLQDIPTIVGSDLKSYGPFKKEDVSNLPYDNAITLIRKGIAEEVESLELSE